MTQLLREGHPTVMPTLVTMAFTSDGDGFFAKDDADEGCGTGDEDLAVGVHIAQRRLILDYGTQK